MDNLSIMQGLDAAIELILRKRAEAAGRSNTIWLILHHALNTSPGRLPNAQRQRKPRPQRTPRATALPIRPT